MHLSINPNSRNSLRASVAFPPRAVALLPVSSLACGLFYIHADRSPTSTMCLITIAGSLRMCDVRVKQLPSSQRESRFCIRNNSSITRRYSRLLNVLQSVEKQTIVSLRRIDVHRTYREKTTREPALASDLCIRFPREIGGRAPQPTTTTVRFAECITRSTDAPRGPRIMSYHVVSCRVALYTPSISCRNIRRGTPRVRRRRGRPICGI